MTQHIDQDQFEDRMSCNVSQLAIQSVVIFFYQSWPVKSVAVCELKELKIFEELQAQFELFLWEIALLFLDSHLTLKWILVQTNQGF